MKNYVEKLRLKDPIIMPTDIGFELVCDASATEAVSSISEAFEPHSATSYAIVVGSIDQLGRYIRNFPEMALEIMEISESPLNMVLPDAINIDERLRLQDGSAPFRLVRKGLIHDLSTKTNKALLAVPASNKGTKVPTKMIDVAPELLKYSNPSDEGVYSFKGKMPSVLSVDMNGVVKIVRD